MYSCRWCGCSYYERQLSHWEYCSSKCLQEERQNGQQKWNQFTGGLVNTLQNQVQIAQLQQQQELAAQQNALIAEQNQRMAAEEAERIQFAAIAEREAMWKQFVFKVNETFDELAKGGDEVSMLAQAEWFRFKCEQQQFSEADLSEIGDKQYFAHTRRRVEAIRKQASEKSHTNYEKFKALYCEYHNLYAHCSVFPQAETSDFQKKPLLTTFSKPRPTLKGLSDETLRTLINPPAELVELRKKGELYVWGIVAVMVCNLCLPGLAFIAAVCIYFFGLRPVKLARQPLEETFQQDLEQAKHKWIGQQKAKHERSVDLWEQERRKFEAKLPEANREIEDHNSGLQHRYDTAQAKWLARKQKAFDVINAYIDKHPTLHAWFPRLTSVSFDKQNADLRKTFKLDS